MSPPFFVVSKGTGDIPPRQVAKPGERLAVMEVRSGPPRELSSQEREP